MLPIAMLLMLQAADSFSPAPLVPSADEPAPARINVTEELLTRMEAAPIGPETRRLYEVAIPGAGLALITWAVSWGVFFDSIDCQPTSGWFNFDCSSASALLLIPQAGPWLALFVGGTRDPYFGHNLALGIGQLTGLIAMVTGFAISVPTDSDTVSMNVVPTGNGFALGGTF